MKRLISILEHFKGTKEELDLIEKETFSIIDSPKFSKTPKLIQDYVYILNMQDINELTIDEIQNILKVLKKYAKSRK